MQAPDSVDRYFTEQVVGQHRVDMGNSSTARHLPRQGVLIDWVSGKAAMSSIAWGSVWAQDPALPALGIPLNPPELGRWKRRVLLAGLAVWSMALGATVYWWRP